MLRGLKSPTDIQVVSRGYGHQHVREAGQRHKQAGHCLRVEPKRPGLGDGNRPADDLRTQAANREARRGDDHRKEELQ